MAHWEVVESKIEADGRRPAGFSANALIAGSATPHDQGRRCQAPVLAALLTRPQSDRAGPRRCAQKHAAEDAWRSLVATIQLGECGDYVANAGYARVKMRKALA